MSEIYLTNDEIFIRTMEEADVKILAEEEIKQGWGDTSDKHTMRIKDMASGISVTFVSVYKGQVTGYVSVYYDYEKLDGVSYPGVVDFGVLEKYRNNGIGTALMDAAENTAFKSGGRIYLGVGLCGDYGAAQRMYIKRGYIPDGKGVYYNDKIAERNKEYPNDDDFFLKLYKDA